MLIDNVSDIAHTTFMNSQLMLGPNGLVYAIKEPDGYVRLYWGPLPFYAYKQDDPEGMRIGIVMLANQGMNHQSIGELFSINRHTVGKIQAVLVSCLEGVGVCLLAYYGVPKTLLLLRVLGLAPSRKIGLVATSFNKRHP